MSGYLGGSLEALFGLGFYSTPGDVRFSFLSTEPMELAPVFRGQPYTATVDVASFGPFATAPDRVYLQVSFDRQQANTGGFTGSEQGHNLPRRIAISGITPSNASMVRAFVVYHDVEYDVPGNPGSYTVATDNFSFDIQSSGIPEPSGLGFLVLVRQQS